MFVGRKNELKLLNDAYRSKKTGFEKMTSLHTLPKTAWS